MIDEETLKRMIADPGSIVLYCMVCREPMPTERARDSKRKTCCPSCYKAIKAYYKEMVRRRYCPSCLHPSTPAQRADYKLWATDRGQRKGNREDGRPAKKREKALEMALGGVLESLKGIEGFEDEKISGEYSEEQRAARIAAVDTSIREAAKLLEVTPSK